MTYRLRCPWLPRHHSIHCILLRQRTRNQKTWQCEYVVNRAEECAGEGVQQVTELVAPFPAQSHAGVTSPSFELSVGRSRLLFSVSSHLSMLRLARVTRLRSFDLSLRIHQRAFSSTGLHKMANESTGTHKDPLTGEMISKQHVLVQITFACAHRSLFCRELKRREKQREKEARKAANAVAQHPASTNDGAADNVANEDNLSPNVSHLCRCMRCRLGDDR